jgi:hypothetical protein
MVVNELAELRLETSTEKAYGVSVIEVSQVALVPLKQGNILTDGFFLAQVSDQIKGIFGIIGIDGALMELVLKNLTG